ncbi:MAG: YdcF family protein [Candidatus Sungbacteria bacterium]|nr:YdcF family protein [Candidatus Sungbacteria bacterium]
MARMGVFFVYKFLVGDHFNSQTRARLEKTLNLYHKKRIEKICVTTAFTVIQWGKEAYLAEIIRGYFLERGVPWEDIIVYTFGFNTAGEIEGCLLVVDPDEPITAISSWYHLPRIVILFAFRKRLARPSPAFGGVTLGDLTGEIPRLWYAFTRPFKSARTIFRPRFAD